MSCSKSSVSACCARPSKEATSEPTSAPSRVASTAKIRWAEMSARPMPNAESTPANGWMKTSVMESESATRQACCPPAPPKQPSTYSDTSKPRWMLIFLMAFAMLSTAIRRKPSAISSGGMPVCCESSANFSRTISSSSRSSAFGPKTAGKCADCSLPSMTLQSVTVIGPPLR